MEKERRAVRLWEWLEGVAAVLVAVAALTAVLAPLLDWWAADPRPPLDLPRILVDYWDL